MKDREIVGICQSEMRIREEIAKKLLALRIKKLDNQTLAKVTGLPTEKIEKLKKRY
ncbi:hypothetical protein [Sulfurimonas sp.]|uniref:hypothetical protein n=1 Tax=Sulfurimonas sp. TaxID=2022749 RepID=UPI0025D7BBAB|nr:hypothetical protein [Sulfurimonas sp.]MDD5158109.1 hypothetical protein [Sulfurimonas sp.]